MKKGDPMSGTGPDKATVDLILTRAGGWCERCGEPLYGERGVGWSIQHRRPRGSGGTKWPGINRPSNLMALCGSGTTRCHGYVESERTRALAAGWLVSQWQDPSTTSVSVRGHAVMLTDDGRYEPMPAPPVFEHDECFEVWSDEIGCAGAPQHTCMKVGEHATHVCRRCDSMVIEVRSARA